MTLTRSRPMARELDGWEPVRPNSLAFSRRARGLSRRLEHVGGTLAREIGGTRWLLVASRDSAPVVLQTLLEVRGELDAGGVAL